MTARAISSLRSAPGAAWPVAAARPHATAKSRRTKSTRERRIFISVFLSGSGRTGGVRACEVGEAAGWKVKVKRQKAKEEGKRLIKIDGSSRAARPLFCLFTFTFCLLNLGAPWLNTPLRVRAGERDERDGRAGRVVDDAEATDVGDVCWRHADLAAEFPDLSCLRVNVVNGDVGHPVRRRGAELRPHFVDAADVLAADDYLVVD